MTEEEWLACTNPFTMLGFARGKISERKHRLYVCACCRLLPQMAVEALNNAVVMAEQYADRNTDKADTRVLSDIKKLCDQVFLRTVGKPYWVWNLSAYWLGSAGHPPYDPATVSYREKHCAILRDNLGNPFRPYRAPPSWPSSVVQLATSLYDGQPCSFALHDTLLEAGHDELAEHFQNEAWHPKGCWALDVILGKT